MVDLVSYPSQAWQADRRHKEKTMGQKQLLFHFDPVLAPNPGLPAAPTMQECAELVDSKNPISPFHNFVGQEPAKKKMGRVLLNALQRPNHCANDVSWLLTGPSSVEIGRAHV